MLDKLAKSIPVGVTLENVRQQGNNVTLLGSAQSNARVSAYLQSLEESDLFRAPELQYVRAAEKPASRVESYEFAIRVRLNPKREQEQQEDADQVAGVN
jgi:type IV pilus assembly protein PilN